MKKLYEETNIQDIAEAIREQNGTDNVYTVAQMGNAVRAIHAQPNLETLNATENRIYLPSAGKDGFSSVNVQVPGGGAVVQPLSVAQNGTYTPPSGVDGYAPVTVNVSGGSTEKLGIIVPELLDTIAATQNSNAAFPVVASLAKYSASYHFGYSNASFDGSSKLCISKTGQHVAGMLYPMLIPAGKYSKLYVKLKADKYGTGPSYRCYISLHNTNSFDSSDGWMDSDNAKLATIIDMNMSVSDINSQTGVKINISSQISCPEQIVEIDIPQDASFYIGVVSWFVNLYIREMYLL